MNSGQGDATIGQSLNILKKKKREKILINIQNKRKTLNLCGSILSQFRFKFGLIILPVVMMAIKFGVLFLKKKLKKNYNQLFKYNVIGKQTKAYPGYVNLSFINPG